MTSFVTWVGVDDRGPASIYLGSDSRISWSKREVWDSGRKVFASRTEPDLLGYVGDVLFPSIALGQLVEAIDAGTLYPRGASPIEKFIAVRIAIEASFANLPHSQRRAFWIAFATREHSKMESVFHLWILAWKGSWEVERVPLPNISSAIKILGSGEPTIDRWIQRWDSSSQGETSRAVFSSLCDAVGSGSDPLSGGAPQLVGLFRIGAGRSFGLHWNQRAYLHGMEVRGSHLAFADVDWRNRLFERVNYEGSLLVNAQRHHKPKGLGGA
jgi:hypothetical protein